MAQDWFRANAPAKPDTEGDNWFTANAPRPDFRADNERDATGAPVVRSAQSRFIGDFITNVNPFPALKGANDSLARAIQFVLAGDPMAGASSFKRDFGGLVQGIGAAQGQVAEEAKAAYDAGDMLTATRKALNWLVPIIGPALDAEADKFAEGNIAGGLGGTLGLGAGMAAPAALAQVRSMRTPRVASRNPVEAQAVEYLADQGVPVDAATATGNRFVRGIQAGADHTPVGALVAEGSARAQNTAMAGLGRRMAGDVSPNQATMVQAGERVRAAVIAKIDDFNAQADAAYTQLRAFEADPTYSTRVVKQPEVVRQTSDGRRAVVQPEVAESIPLSVDVRAAKTALRPIYDDLLEENRLVPLLGARGRALTTLHRLMNGPDNAPLSVVDGALGELKGMARGPRGQIPALRSQGQGIAAEAVKRLELQVTHTAQRAGPEVYAALRRGREATTRKFQVNDVLEELKVEPVRTIRSLVEQGDAGIERLRLIAREIPGEMPIIGRAYLDDLIDQATKAGGFEKNAKLWAEWSKLGNETKKVLFPNAQHVKDLDNFFLGARALAERANPSGTATTKVAIGSLLHMQMHPATALPLWASAGVLSAMLHSPKIAMLLARGVRIPMGNTAAGAAATAEIVTLAREMGMLPRMAGGEEAPTMSAPPRPGPPR